MGIRLLVAALLALSISLVAGALAEGHTDATIDLASVQPTQQQLFELRQALAEFEDVEAAMVAGYEQFGGCMIGPQGAQGIHYTKGSLIENPELDPLQP